jgi:isopenicillin N synthase-like dioxygenase
MATADSPQIPIIDFGRFATDFDGVAEEIKSVCETWGFLYLKNHGMKQESIDRIFEIADGFFKHTLQSEKDLCPWNSIHNAGYQTHAPVPAYFSDYGTADKTQEADPKEIFSFRKENSYDQPLPPTLARARPDIQGFLHEAHQTIAVPVLECLSATLGLDRKRLPDLHRWEKPSVGSLRLLHYPALKPGEEAPVRLASHTDQGVITVLFQHKIMGLQVRPPIYTGPVQPGEKWLDAPVIPGTVLINIGETMTYLSGGRMKSTLHRVARSPRTEEHYQHRYTAVYFCHANEDTPLEVLEGLEGGVKHETPISCVTGRPVKTVKDWIEHRHSLGRELPTKQIAV